MDTETKAPHWTELVYRENARLLFDVEAAIFQNDELTRREIASVERLADKLGTSIASPVCDIACGPGRHSIELARQGFDVTGLDFSPSLLAIARESAAARRNGGSMPTFVSGDMRQLDFADGAFRTALILGNSFGYFSDQENLQSLREACRVLGDGGFFCLEISHKDRYLAGLESFSEEYIEGRFHPRLKCEWSKSWDGNSRRVTTIEKHSIAASEEILYEGPYDVRLYDQDEISGLLEDLGLRHITCMSFSPGHEILPVELGETFGAMEEILFIGGVK